MTPSANDAASGVSIATLARLRRCLEACALTSSEHGMQLFAEQEQNAGDYDSVEVAAMQIALGGK